MPFDFDEMIDRRNTDSIKYDSGLRRGKPADVLPLWVADMDFRTPPAVAEALIARARHGVFGYSETGKAYFDAVRGWFERRFSYYVQPEWLVETPGVVFALSVALRAYTQPGDAVIIQQPVYYPFAEMIQTNGRRMVVNELLYRDGAYSIDFEDFESKIRQNGVKAFILCSPHNPVGRVWTRKELVRLGEICLQNNVLVVSDEIHADFVYPGHTHTVFAGISEAFANNCVLCTAPSKTFNLAGLQISNIFIPNPERKRAFAAELRRMGQSHPNVMGMDACRAAYTHGEQWLDELRAYLLQNLAFLRGFVKESLPGIRLVEPEGTYLAWLDFNGLGLSGRELDDFMLHKAGLWLDAGEMFGAGGAGFQRVNIACPRATLKLALEKLDAALREYGK